MKSELEYLRPVDAAWFRMERRDDPADIVALMRFDGRLDEARLRELIQARLLCHPRFLRRAVDSPRGITPPHWEPEPAFSIDAHLSRIDLPPLADEAALRRAIDELLGHRLDFSRSPWRLWLIDGLPGGSALVAQLHHCMGDGFGLLDVLLTLTDASSPGDGPGARAVQAPRSDRAARHEHFAALKGGVDALKHVLLMPFDPPNRLRGRPSGVRRVAWSRRMPLWPVKRLAAARGWTVNDVLMSALASALRRYALSHGDLPVDVRAIVPVNLRPPHDPEQARTDPRHNWFGLVFLELPLRDPDRESRAAKLRREMDRIKTSKEALVSLGFLEALGRSPTVVDRFVDEIFARKASIVVTNVPGPRQPVELAGCRLRDMAFWAPHPCGLGCGASILSYAGMFRLGMRSDVAVVADPELVTRYFEEELEDWLSIPRDAAEASA